jgi:hypothetical protein
MIFCHGTPTVAISRQELDFHSLLNGYAEKFDGTWQPNRNKTGLGYMFGHNDYEILNKFLMQHHQMELLSVIRGHSHINQLGYWIEGNDFLNFEIHEDQTVITLNTGRTHPSSNFGTGGIRCPNQQSCIMKITRKPNGTEYQRYFIC